MLTVLSGIAALIGLLGLGACVLLPVRGGARSGSIAHGETNRVVDRRGGAALLAAAMGYGVLVNYTLVLVVGALNLAAALAVAFAIPGTIVALVRLRRTTIWKRDITWLAALHLFGTPSS